jgi:hypothetical protein
MPKPVRAEHLMPDDKDFAELNGVTIRKGTMGAFFANLRILRETAEDSPDRDAIIEELKQGIPTVRENGLFELFTFRSPELAKAIGVVET